MEVCVTSNTPACRDISSVSVSSTDLNNSTYYSSGCLPMNDLKICLTEFVSVEDIEMPTSGFNLFPGDNNKCLVVREYELEDSGNRKTSNSSTEKSLSDRVTFSALAEPKSSVNGLLGGEKAQNDCKTSELDESAKSVNKSNAGLTSLPSDAMPSETPLKLVSAMKGSREKQGIAPKKLSVTWAPDVYDPTPTSVSHVPSSKNHRYHNNSKKRYGKNKHKGSGKSSRGSMGKDKKQSRKNGGGTSKLRPLHSATG